MSPRLPAYTGKDLLKILQEFGFVIVRQKGSHVFLAHEDGRMTLIPLHKGEDVGRGLLRSIIRQTGIPLERFF